MTQIKLDVGNYALRVLDVVKGQHGLKNRNEAFEKFVEEFGEAYTSMKIDEQVLRRLDSIVEDHKKEYGTKKMSDEELDDLLGL